MFTLLGLQNFKAFGSYQFATLAPVTLIYGPNSSGKSSLLQSLLFLKQSIEAGAVNVKGPYVDLGSFSAMSYRHSTEPFVLSVAVRPPSAPDAYYEDFAQRLVPDHEAVRACVLKFNKHLAPRGQVMNTPVLSGVMYSLVRDANNVAKVSLGREAADTGAPGRFKLVDKKDARELAVKMLLRAGEGGANYLNDTRNASANGVAALMKELMQAPLRADYKQLLPTEFVDPWKSYEIWREMGKRPKPPRVSRNLSWVIPGDFAQVLGREFGRIAYIGPHRARGERRYVPTNSNPDNVGTAGEHAIAFLRRGLFSDVYEKKLDHWLEVLDIPFRVRVRSVYDDVVGESFRVTLVDQRTGVRVSPADVGYGFAQVLPIIVQAFDNERTVLVEQPELHLHPRLQAELADLFLTTAALPRGAEEYDADGPIQWIIETHSEALLLRVQRRIREKSIRPDGVAILYVEPGEEGSRLLHLRLDEEGNFMDEWPQGFFEERFQEIFSK